MSSDEASSPRFFPLQTIVNRIRDLLAPAMSKKFWLKAEISSGRERGGTYYCDLIETDSQGKVLAQMRCTIWVRDLYKMRAKFREAGLELKLENGMLAGFECRLQHHPVYGLSLNAVDIDPGLALGELELKKRRIIEKLQKEQLDQVNCMLPVPLLPNRIGLITSVGSAAYKDFVETLHHGSFGFKILSADCAVQGDDTEGSILYALDVLESKKVDLVVIIRGGGSKTDLAWLDNEAIARRVAQFKKPIWTGIGHEIDTSVLDYVAASSFKTPTAVAEEILGRFDAIERHIEEAAQQLLSSWNYRYKNEIDAIQQARKGIVQGSRKLLEYSKSECSRRKQELKAKSSEFIYEHRSHLRTIAHRITSESRLFLKEHKYKLSNIQKSLKDRANHQIQSHHIQWKQIKNRFQSERFLSRLRQDKLILEQKNRALQAFDPQKVLDRGFMILKGKNNKSIKSVSSLKKGMSFEATLADGRFKGTVDEIDLSNET